MTFPIVAIKDACITFQQDEQRFRSFGRRTLNRGQYFDHGGPVLIDARGVQYRITAITNARDTGRHAFKRPWYLRPFAPTLWEADIDVEVVCQLSLDEVRDKLLAAIKADPTAWDLVIGYEADDVINALERASSIDDLWTVIGNPSSLTDESQT